jgi:pSer/pThr/pTyr-binding forkhead associated (FHA) protein
MSQQHPELIFVSGPQAGQRIVLARPSAVLGRGGGADILLSEEFVSRRQARYELLPGGCSLENLSDRGTWISGKRFKAGKRVLLETGDVIGVGRETQILFVAAGDDAEAAVQAYRKSSASGRNAFGKKVKVKAASAPPPAAAEPAVLEPVETAEEPKAPEPQAPVRAPPRTSEMSADERLLAQAKARRRKILIGLSIYLLIIVFVGVLGWMTLGKVAPQVREVPILTPEQISDYLSFKIEDITPNPVMKEKRLNYALGLYQQYGLNSTKLYECARAFKEALAYSGRTFFEDPQHDQIYGQVLRRLTEVVTTKYQNACRREKNKDWMQAEKEFHELLAIVGDERNPLWRNILGHHSRVKYYRQLKAPGQRTPWM